MDIFLKATACVLVAVVLCQVFSKSDKDFSVWIGLAVCCLVITAAVTYLDPLISFIRQLQRISEFDSEMVQILLKSVGIGLIAQIAELICADAGNAALGKSLQILATAVILWLSIPMMNGLLELIGKVLGEA